MKNFEIVSVDRVYSGFFAVDNAHVRYELPSGEMSSVQPRLCVERGDSASVLLLDTDTQQLILVRQFRYPCVAHGNPWPLEIAAGKVDPGETPEEAAIREVHEELGYQVKSLTKIGQFYSSPGGMSELNHIFFAAVTTADKIGEEGGLEEEGVYLERLSIAQALDLLNKQLIVDGKALVALQWFALNHPNH